MVETARSLFSWTVEDMISTTAAINSCATAYQWHRALELLKGMADRPDVSTYSSALSACDLAGRWREAVQLVEEMNEQQLPVDGMHVGCVVGAALKALGRGAAEQWLRNLRSREPPLQLRQQLGESIGGRAGLQPLARVCYRDPCPYREHALGCRRYWTSVPLTPSRP